MIPLVIFHKQLGDGVLLEPALRALAEQHGRVALFGTPVLQTVAELMPNVEWRTQPTGNFSEVWAFEPGSRCAWDAFRARAPLKRLRLRKITHRRWYHRLVFNDLQTPEHKDVHNALFFLRGVVPEALFTPPRLIAPPDTWKSPRLPDGPFIAVNMTASLEEKAWEAEKWRASLTELRATGLPLVLLGAGPAWVEKHVAEASAGTDAVNLVNRTSLREFIHAVSCAKLHLSLEGAAAHLAMAFQVPAIALFSRGNSANPLNWYAPGPAARILIDPAAKWAAKADSLASPADLIRHARELI